MSEQKKPKLTKGLVTSDAVLAKARVKRPLLFSSRGLIIVAILLITLGILGGYLYKVYIYDPAHKPKSTSKTTKLTTYSQRIDNALSSAQTQVQSVSTPKDKAEAYVTLGTAYENKNQNQQAIDAFQTALSIDGTDDSIKSTVLGAIGYAYARNGQRDKAVTTFQQLIDQLQQNKQTPYYDAAIQAYQNDIQWLKEGKSI